MGVDNAKIEYTQNVRVMGTQTWYKRPQKHPPILGLAGVREPGFEAGSLSGAKAWRVRRLVHAFTGSETYCNKLAGGSLLNHFL